VIHVKAIAKLVYSGGDLRITESKPEGSTSDRSRRSIPYLARRVHRDHWVDSHQSQTSTFPLASDY
jgi:hypothetical protein